MARRHAQIDRILVTVMYGQKTCIDRENTGKAKVTVMYGQKTHISRT